MSFNRNFEKLRSQGPTGLIFFAVFLYGTLCLIHLLSQRPFWNDEACVFLSIKDFEVQQIFGQPLLSIQVFPRLYLLFIQQFSKIFDFHLIALRFLPFVCMMTAFALWLKIASYELKNKTEYLMFALSWTASALLIYYSAELKQYSMDVLVGALFILFLYHQERFMHERRGLFNVIIAVLPAMLMFSYISIFFLLLPLYNMVLFSRKEPKALLSMALYIVSLLFFCTLSYHFDIRLRAVAVLEHEWRNYFISTESVVAFLRSLTEGIMKLFCCWFAERPKIIKRIGIFFSVFGFIYLFSGFFKNVKKDRYYIRSLQTIPFALFTGLFILGILKKYPFTVPRTSLFFCPIVLFLIIKGIVSLKNIHLPFYRVVYFLYFIFLTFLSVALSRLVLMGNFPFRPVLW